MEHSVDHLASVDPDISLQQHEANSMQRAAQIEHSINQIKGTKMTDGTSNVFHHGLGGAGYGNGAGVGAAMGGGLGAGLLGGILGGALLGGNGGLFGGNRGGHEGNWNAGNAPLSVDMAATQTMGLNQAIAGVGNQVTMGNQMLTNSTNAGFATAATDQLQQTIMLINGNAALSRDVWNANQNVLVTANQTQASVTADGDKTRALIQSINDATLNRIITTQANEITELKGDRGLAATGLNINQTVTQVQAQAQQQQQQQNQLILLAQIAAGFNSLQNAVATNSNLIVGNTGATTTGAQTASPVNVKG